MKESQQRFSITLLSTCCLELLPWLPSPTNCHLVTSLTTCRMKCSMNITLSSPKLPSVMASSTVTENKEDNASDYSSLGQPHWSSLLSLTTQWSYQIPPPCLCFLSPKLPWSFELSQFWTVCLFAVHSFTECKHGKICALTAQVVAASFV